MSIELYCPHCKQGLRIASQYVGHSIDCPECKQKFTVPTPVAVIKPQVATPQVSMTERVRRRQRKSPAAICFRLIMIAISIGGPLVAGYFLFKRLDEFKRAVEQQPKEVAVRTTPEQPREQTPNKVPIRRESIKREPPPRPNTEKPAQVETSSIAQVQPAPAPVVSPLEKIPTAVALPGISVKDSAVLFSVPEGTEVWLESNAPQLALKGSQIVWRDKAVLPAEIATLETRDESIAFHWRDNVAEEAATALQNSVLVLRHQDDSHSVALRQRSSVPPLKFDLSKAKQTIVCDLSALPPLADIRFDVVKIAGVKVTDFTGAEQHGLEIKQESLAWYAGTDRIASRFSTRKRGKTVLAEISHGYALPSGREEILTIARGNKRYKELESLTRSAANAAASINGLRSQLRQQTSERGRIARLPATSSLNGQQVPNTVAAAQKRFALEAADRAIAETQSLIAEAEGLIADRPVIEREFLALDRIGLFAKELHTKGWLAYRFYFLVGEYEVDLIVSDHPSTPEPTNRIGPPN